ncbi:hypothetical protein AAC978_15300 [Desulfitobacterium sp. THU1]|uniref:DUF3021 family protein n=1 Tax=Desulfitobacterium sp. THU1 TaxID=3138072 RepID=UPI00311FE7EA
MNFFIIVTCVTLVIGVLGLIYEPDRRFGYEAYFSPLIFGLIGVVPSFVTYSKREPTLRQMMIRKIFQLFVLEAMILSFGYGMDIMYGPMMFAVAGAVFAVFLLVHFFSYAIDYREATRLNAELKLFQER